MAGFSLKMPYPPNTQNKTPVVKLKPDCYQKLCVLKAKTGLPLGNIVEQCIDYALKNMEGPNANT